MDYYSYFQSYKDYFWQWEEGDGVIAIPAGNTIAYRDFILEVLHKLSPRGVPPFSALLQAMVATNANGVESLEAIQNILRPHQVSNEDTTFDDAMEVLNLLTSLPGQYKVGNKRILLFQALFEGCHNGLSAKGAVRIVEWFSAGKYELEKFTLKKELSSRALYHDFRTIALLKSRFRDVKSLLEKIASLPEIPEEIELAEDPAGEKAGSIDFVDQLIANNTTFPVGALVRRLWSGLNIPFHNNQPSRQPLGGVSDLTNKGDFDKLLISEFANDDLVFLSRLANNEALYLQREVPPARNNLQRVILIDLSLKNWGTPKVLAFATMLAVARHPKTDIECVVYGIGEAYHPLLFNTIDALVESLQLLDVSLSAARGLSAFLKDFPASKQREVILISTLAAYQQSEMLKVVNENYKSIHYWIHTEDDGCIEIFKRQQNSKRHVQHIQLALNELWKKEVKQQMEGPMERLPQYPILFRNSFNAKKFLSTPDGEVFQITTDKGVLRFTGNGTNLNEKGWELVYEKVPFIAGEFELGLLENGEYVLLMFNPQGRAITLLNLSTGAKKEVLFNEWKSSRTPGFVFYQEKFYHFNPRGSWSIGIDEKVEKDNLQDIALYRKREEELNGVRGNYTYGRAILKNVREVYLNQLNNLVFNSHELWLNEGHQISLGRSNFGEKTVQARKTGKSEFTFPDGSLVEINKSGMFLLKSSNPGIPIIYVPSVPDDTLGVATEVAFAGNEYYYREPQYKIYLINAGMNKLAIVKELNDSFGMGLKKAKELVDGTPALIGSYPKLKILEVRRELRNMGAQVKLEEGYRREQYEQAEIQKISTTAFFEQYINPFISNIQANGIKA